MSATSTIEWTDASWNPIRARDRTTGKIGWHCEHVSEGCRNCYAESINRRLGTGLNYKPGELANSIEVFLDEKMLLAPLRWKRPRKIFVGSMTDLFAAFVTDEWLDCVFAVMALCPHHTFQLLTKRPERMRKYCSNIQRHGNWLAMEDFALQLGKQPRGADNNGFDWLAHKQMLPNVWLGTSVEDQPTADERIPHLLATPAAIRFLSCEPLLGPIDINRARIREPLTVHWVIAGGESGPKARPMHPDWPRSLRDQCAAAGVSFFFKQWGEFHPDGQAWADGSHAIAETPGEEIQFHRSGKKAAGRLLDNRTHSEFPS